MRAELVATSVLLELAQDVGAPAVAGMIDLFVDSLPTRVARLRTAVLAGDHDEAHVAVLSLGTSAAMLGAQRLADAATQYARCSSVHAPDQLLSAVAERTGDELREIRQRLMLCASR